MTRFLTPYKLVYMGYSTVRDYTDYFDKYPQLLGPKGDLKDVQRPWVLEAVRKHVDLGSNIIDMGGASCELASYLCNDYQVTVVDPYDGTGNGPKHVAHLQKKHPNISFIKDVLNSQTEIGPDWHAVISSSVIEHIRPDNIPDAIVGIDEALRPGGYSIHAIDFTVRGEGIIKDTVDKIISQFFDTYNITTTITELRNKIIGDHETYYLSPLMYQQWRKTRTYDEYPWRQVATLNVILNKQA